MIFFLGDALYLRVLISRNGGHPWHPRSAGPYGMWYPFMGLLKIKGYSNNPRTAQELKA